MTSSIILALDTQDIEVAKRWIEATNSVIQVYKVGLEFFLTYGPHGVDELRECGEFDLFLDLKLHDIPNTVAGAVRSVRHLEPRFLTVHASGGPEMISAAAKEAPTSSITAVTVLTSLDDAQLNALGFRSGALDTATGLARTAIASGARSIVCSPHEVAAIRSLVPDTIELITPGVRPLGSDQGDQRRTMTPDEAISAGANFVVIGRPITSFWQESASAMRSAALRIQTDIEAVLS